MLNIHPIRSGTRSRQAFVLLVLAGLGGCRGKVERPMPKLYPVMGKVVVSQGQLPPEGTVIQFMPSNAELMAQGFTDAGGNFVLATVFNEKKLPGAAEGSCRVAVVPPIRQDRTGGDPIVLKESYKVEPQENRITVKLGIPPDRW
jgi:hypothetical protein